MLFELLIAFALGLFTMLTLMWLFGAKKGTIFFMLMNSLLSIGVLLVCVFATDIFSLNAFTVYLTSFFGLAGVGIIFALTQIN